MSERLERYHRQKARTELRAELLYPLIVFVLSAVGLAVQGLVDLASGARLGSSLVEVAGALILGSIAHGLFRLRRWVRWPAVLLLGIGSVISGVLLWRNGFELSVLLCALGYGSSSLSLATPAAGALFDRAAPDGAKA